MIAKLIDAMFTSRFPRGYIGRHRVRPAPVGANARTARATRAGSHGATAL